MKEVPLCRIFDVQYGSQLDFNKMSLDDGGVNFVSRSRNNLGVVGRVKRLEDVRPYEAGAITVTLGGSYLLSSFVQPRPFYTAQNIKVLRPKRDMTFNEKVYYCTCIEMNRFKYSSHGREANKSLDNLRVPAISAIPTWVNKANGKTIDFKSMHGRCGKKPFKRHTNEKVPLWRLFDTVNGLPASQVKRAESKISEDHIPYIRPSSTQRASFVAYVDRREIDSKHVFPIHSLYVSTNGQGSHTYSYVSNCEFVPNTDVTVLLPKREMSLQEKLYYAMAITCNRRRFSYGRKPKGNRLKDLVIPLYPPEYVYERDYFEEIIGKKGTGQKGDGALY